MYYKLIGWLIDWLKTISENRFKFDSMEQKSEQGFNTISAVHKQLQVRL